MILTVRNIMATQETQKKILLLAGLLMDARQHYKIPGTFAASLDHVPLINISVLHNYTTLLFSLFVRQIEFLNSFAVFSIRIQYINQSTINHVIWIYY